MSITSTIIGTIIRGVDMDERYTSLLVARFSPENGCHVRGAQPLTVVPRRTVPLRQYVPHYFVAASDKATKSRYGWTSQVEPFSMDEFIQMYHADSQMSEVWVDHIRTMLQSIRGLGIGAAVAADYGKRGFGQAEMVFSVHRVFFQTQPT